MLIVFLSWNDTLNNLRKIANENNIQHANRLGVLAADGYCRPFDIDATGYTRSEAICMIFLQKARDSKRVYSTVLYSKANCDGKVNHFLEIIKFLSKSLNSE